MGELQSYLREKVKQINGDNSRLKLVRDWINGFWGKIIEFKTGDESYHLVFTRDGAALRDGEYPSCEALYLGDEKAIMEVLRKESSAYSSVKGGKLKVWGSLNEAKQFESLL